LGEVYYKLDDPARHKETAHYAKWRDTVTEMMAEPRSSVKYDSEELEKERIEKVKWPIERGYLTSARIRQALLKVPREVFIAEAYRDYAYRELPFPLPCKRATISSTTR
jgi:hypothetical protein